MLYQFDTDSLSHAKAALLLYGMYRSRKKESPLNGLETWDRFQTFVRGACLKATTTAEFVQAFCKKAKIDSVKPRYFSTGDPVLMSGTGELISSAGIEDYRLGILADDSLERLKLYEDICFGLDGTELLTPELLRKIRADLNKGRGG